MLLSGGAHAGNISVINNTFIGGNVYCTDSGNYFRELTDNIFYQVESAETSTACSYDYNLFQPSLGIGTNGATGDPLFVDVGHGDFHLASGSPAIDAGAPDRLTNSHDFDGRLRPAGARPDLGAFEYGPPAGP